MKLKKKRVSKYDKYSYSIYKNVKGERRRTYVIVHDITSIDEMIEVANAMCFKTKAESLTTIPVWIYGKNLFIEPIGAISQSLAVVKK